MNFSLQIAYINKSIAKSESKAQLVCTQLPTGSILNYSLYLFNPTGETYMRQLFHCLQWYAGSILNYSLISL